MKLTPWSLIITMSDISKYSYTDTFSIQSLIIRIAWILYIAMFLSYPISIIMTTRQSTVMLFTNLCNISTCVTIHILRRKLILLNINITLTF